MAEKSIAERLKEIEAAIQDLKARMPAHSTPPFMLLQLEVLEEELEELKKEVEDLGEDG